MKGSEFDVASSKRSFIVQQRASMLHVSRVRGKANVDRESRFSTELDSLKRAHCSPPTPAVCRRHLAKAQTPTGIHSKSISCGVKFRRRAREPKELRLFMQLYY